MNVLAFSSSRTKTSCAMSGVFCLYIRVKLKTDAIPEFLERWGKLASHVRANEPETLSYELCRSDQNEDEFMIVERYPSRAQLEDPHQTSEEFKAFKEWWTSSGVVLEKSGMSCVETGVGYMSK